MALIHVAAASAGRAPEPRDGLAIAGAPGDLAGRIETALAGAIPARARIDPFYALPRSSEMIAAYLESRPFHLPIGHHRLRVLSDLAPCAKGDGEEVTAFRRLAIALATGNRIEALAVLEGHGRSCFTVPVRRLAETGVVDLPGRRGRSVFVGSLDDPDEARPYAPSMPLLRELLWRGPGWRVAADRVIARLAGEDAHDGRMLAAIADAEHPGRGDVAARVRHLRGPARRYRALVAMAGAAISAGDVDGAETILALLPPGEHRERVLLAMAWSALDRAARIRAAERLDPQRDPCLVAVTALTRAGLGLGPERTPLSWRRLPTHAPRHLPELPGEAITLPSFFSDVLFEAQLDPAAKKLAVALAPPAGPWLTLIEDATVALRLARRRSIEEVASAAPEPLAGRVAGALRSARVMASALDLLGARVAAAKLVTEDRAPLTTDAAFLLGALGPADSLEACRHDPRFDDALSPLRAAYDDGVSVSTQADARRTVLLDACRASLRAIEAGAPCEDPAAVVASRLSCLVNLGGEVAATIVRRSIEASPSSGGPHGPALFEALGSLDPRRAVNLLVRRGGATIGVHDPAEAIARLSAGDLDRTYLDRWHAALERLRTPLGRERASAWLEDLARVFVERSSALPPAAALDAVAAPGEPIALSGEAFVQRLTERFDHAVGAGDTDAFLKLLEDDTEVLQAVVALTSGTAPPAPHWSIGDWAKVVARLRHGIGSIDESPLGHFKRALPEGEAAIAALLRGAAPTAALAQPIAFDGAHSLRWLDKRRDFCRSLRFPDVLPNCFNAASAHYLTMDTQRDVLAIHRDPLSFCLQITQREDGDPAAPVGFAFGSFGIAGNAPVALLSGLYLRRQSPELRASGLAAIEEALCRPLGLVSLALSARFAGAGTMPAAYTFASRRVCRLRALAGSPPHPRDDLGLVPNAEPTTPPALYWRDLDG